MNGAEKGMPILQVEGLKKSFGKLEVLRGIDEQIREGEAVSIIGPSGGGKSTFLRCLNLLETPTAGNIYFRGVNVMDKRNNIDRYRQKIGMVFQNFNVFPHMTALENITLAPMLEKKLPRAEAEEKACALLERVGLLDKRDVHPVKLSGGQKQRLAIVRALAMEPEILLFDEPTASCIYTQKGNKKIRKPQAANQTALIFDRRAAARLLSINSIRRLCWS